MAVSYFLFISNLSGPALKGSVYASKNAYNIYIKHDTYMDNHKININYKMSSRSQSSPNKLKDNMLCGTEFQISKK